MMKFFPYKILEIELTKGISEISGLENYGYARILLKYSGEPLGFTTIPVYKGKISAESIHKSLSKFALPILELKLRWSLLQAKNASSSLDEILRAEQPPASKKELFITVAVCSLNRTSDLERCLPSLEKLKYSNYEVVIVDNAPDDNGTELLVKNRFPKFRYVMEPVAGLDNARNKAIAESKGEIVAFADDDVFVDENWLTAISNKFQESEDIAAVTGLVFPYEIETEAQYLFDVYGGFSRGVRRKYLSAAPHLEKIGFTFAGSGQFGTGANMAYRKSVFEKIGVFDPALDTGTPTQSGGDTEMFFRIIKEGYTLAYEPCAMMMHKDRREFSKLKKQLSNYGVGFYSHLVRTALYYKDERFQVLKLGLYWLYAWSIKRLFIIIFRPNRFPRELIWAEFMGSFKGLYSYFISREKVPIKFERKHNEKTVWEVNSGGKYVAEAEITDLALSFPETKKYSKSKFIILFNGKLIDTIEIANKFREVKRERLIYEAAAQLNVKFLDAYNKYYDENAVYELVIDKIRETIKPASVNSVESLRPSVSIVVATYDRPADLQQCLTALKKSAQNYDAEIIVVDNNPSSGVAPKALEEFKDVKLLNEIRKGSSYARNKGFLHAKGEIIVSLDEDIVVPENWLKNLLEPFNDSAVTAVTGNVLPYTLESKAENMFEQYGGFGKGPVKCEVGAEWFAKYRYKAVPTWNLGGTGNVAFRSFIIRDERIGLLHEALGAGMPTGCSEDSYFFYKIIKAGYNIVYNPQAYALHKHRANMRSLRKQLYNYSKGHVASNLLTVFNDDDFRGLTRTFVELPIAHLYRIYCRLRRWNSYPVRNILIEILGNMAGPFALVRSLARVKKLNKLYDYEGGANQAYIAAGKLELENRARLGELQTSATEFGKGNLQNIN
ncbi:MAG TPA: glycosyltransferase [Ignavibacteriales bacterium]|nr:glycosyltransferase [Ignavibacteriales bacterium]